MQRFNIKSFNIKSFNIKSFNIKSFNIKSAIQVCTWISSLMIILISDSVMAGKVGNPSQLSGHLTTALQGICHSLSNLGISTRTVVSEVKNPPMSVFLQAGNTSSKQYYHGQQVSFRKNRAKISSFPLMMGRRKNITSGQSILSPTALMASRSTIDWHVLGIKSFTTSAPTGGDYFEDIEAETEAYQKRNRERVKIRPNLIRDHVVLRNLAPAPCEVRSKLQSGETVVHYGPFTNQGFEGCWRVPPTNGVVHTANYAYSTCSENVCAIYFRIKSRVECPDSIDNGKIHYDYRDYRLVTLYRVESDLEPEAWGVMRRLEEKADCEPRTYTVRVTLEKNEVGHKALRFDYYTRDGDYFTSDFWPQRRGPVFTRFQIDNIEVPWAPAREQPAESFN